MTLIKRFKICTGEIPAKKQSPSFNGIIVNPNSFIGVSDGDIESKIVVKGTVFCGEIELGK